MKTIILTFTVSLVFPLAWSNDQVDLELFSVCTSNFRTQNCSPTDLNPCSRIVPEFKNNELCKKLQKEFTSERFNAKRASMIEVLKNMHDDKQFRDQRLAGCEASPNMDAIGCPNIGRSYSIDDGYTFINGVREVIDFKPVKRNFAKPIKPIFPGSVTGH